MRGSKTIRSFYSGKPGADIMAALILTVSLALAPVRTHGAGPALFIGPMAHWNYGGGASRFSIALEGSYWFDHTKTPIPMGFDFALEWQSPDIWRIYSEAQAGIFLVGYSAGPVLEFGRGRIIPGLQSSMWANILFGADIRGRLMAAGPHSYGNGFYIKAPLYGIDGSLIAE